jgi:fructokinase
MTDELNPAATEQAEIAVLGEALVDIFKDRSVLGGAPFNVARNLAALGCKPHFFTRIGADELGVCIQAECQRFGMSLKHVQIDRLRPTGAVKVSMRGQEHSFEILPDRAWDDLDGDRVSRELQQLAPKWVYFGTLAQRGPVSRQAIREGVNATWATSFLDLNLRSGADDATLVAASMQLADVVKVNEEELHRLLTWFSTDPVGSFASREHLGQVMALLDRFDVLRLFVTRGPEGYVAYERELGVTHEGKARPVAVQDTVGAGDAFSSVLLLGALRNWPLPVTLQRAADFASAVCTLPGAVSTDLSWYVPWVQAWTAADTQRSSEQHEAV